MSERELYVVTGAAGFIGSNIAADFAKRGRRVVAVDWLGDGEKWRNLAGVALHDLIRPDAFPAWRAAHTAEVAAVVHMGAISATTERDVDRLVHENVRLSLDLWEWCTETATPFIYASSAATYGDGSAGFDDDDSEDGLEALRPLNAYGWSKHVVDRRIARDAEEGRPTPPRWAGLKLFNVYGPGEAHKGPMRSVARQIWEATRAGEPVRLFRSHDPDYADGGQLRDFVWVGDCVEVVEWLLNAPDARSGIYNLGTGQARSFLDLAHAVFAATRREPVIEFIDTPAELRARYQYFTEARIERLRAAGYAAPFLRLEDGVAAYVRALEQGA